MMSTSQWRLVGLSILAVVVPASAKVVETRPPDAATDRAFAPKYLTTTEARSSLATTDESLTGASFDTADRKFAVEAAGRSLHGVYGKFEFTGGRWVARVTREEWACPAPSTNQKR